MAFGCQFDTIREKRECQLRDCPEQIDPWIIHREFSLLMTNEGGSSTLWVMLPLSRWL